MARCRRARMPPAYQLLATSLSEELLEPGDELGEEARRVGGGALAGFSEALGTVEGEPGRGREARTPDRVRQTGEPFARNAEAHRRGEDLLGQLREPGQSR